MTDEKQLKEYKGKRDFSKTPEPIGNENDEHETPIYVIQKHDASNLHYDLRLESNGVLKSWAVPKGPSMDPSVKRLAITTEDHPIAYADFEGVIPEGHYGAGTVIVWDYGTFKNTKDDISFEEALEDGHATIDIKGQKLEGEFALIRTNRGGKNQWLFFKMKDGKAKPDSDIAFEQPNSAKSERSLDEVAEQEEPADLNGFE